MPRLVADRIGINLGCADGMKEPIGKLAGDQGVGSGIMAMPDSFRPASIAKRLYAGGNLRHGIIPADGDKFPFSLCADASQRCPKPGLRIPPYPIIGLGTFSTEGTATNVVLGIAENLAELPVLKNGDDTATIVAIPWAGATKNPLFGKGS